MATQGRDRYIILYAMLCYNILFLQEWSHQPQPPAITVSTIESLSRINYQQDPVNQSRQFQAAVISNNSSFHRNIKTDKTETDQNKDERGRKKIFESFYETSTPAPLASPEAVSLSSRTSVVNTAQSQVCSKTRPEHQPRRRAQLQPEQISPVIKYCDLQTHCCPELNDKDNNISSFYDISCQDFTVV